MKTFNPKELSVFDCLLLMNSLVVPRPIAFASTIDKEGNVNLSPFSYFNMFSVNPPILAFSTLRRNRDGTTKHTLENVLEVPEVVINVVNFELVEQASLASVEYEKGVNEFIKSGLTPLASEIVQPPRVAESPASFECKVNQVIPFGEGGGAGNLIICEVLLIHTKEKILDETGKKASPFLLDSVARMGGDFYCRPNGDSVFVVPKPNQKKGIGVDMIPEKIRNSSILTGNNLGRLGNIEKLPERDAVLAFRKNEHLQDIFVRFVNDKESMEEYIHLFAQEFLKEGKLEEAWLVLLQEF